MGTGYTGIFIFDHEATLFDEKHRISKGSLLKLLPRRNVFPHRQPFFPRLKMYCLVALFLATLGATDALTVPLTIKMGKNNQCLSAFYNTDPSRPFDGAISTWECQNTINQQWTMEWKSITTRYNTKKDVFQLKNVYSGKCLDISQGNTAAGASVMTWDCHAVVNKHKTQGWTKNNFSPPLSKLASALTSEFCAQTQLTKVGLLPGEAIVMGDCSGAPNVELPMM